MKVCPFLSNDGYRDCIEDDCQWWNLCKKIGDGSLLKALEPREIRLKTLDLDAFNICGKNGCDGKVISYGFEGSECQKCGEWFI